MLTLILGRIIFFAMAAGRIFALTTFPTKNA